MYFFNGFWFVKDDPQPPPSSNASFFKASTACKMMQQTDASLPVHLKSKRKKIRGA
jgi:hypothetical protein